MNLSGSKTFSLPWEGIQLQIRADASERVQPSQLRCARRCQPWWLSRPRHALYERLDGHQQHNGERQERAVGGSPHVLTLIELCFPWRETAMFAVSSFCPIL